MGALAEMEKVAATVGAVVGELEPERLAGGDAAALVEVFATVKKLCGAGEALAARRVAETMEWRRAGERSAAHWLARRTGSTVGAAAASIETAQRLEDLPATDQAFRTGRLSRSKPNTSPRPPPGAPTPKPNCSTWPSATASKAYATPAAHRRRRPGRPGPTPSRHPPGPLPQNLDRPRRRRPPRRPPDRRRPGHRPGRPRRLRSRHLHRRPHLGHQRALPRLYRRRPRRHGRRRPPRR